MSENNNTRDMTIVPEQSTLALGDVFLDFDYRFKTLSCKTKFSQWLQRYRATLGLDNTENIVEAYIEKVWPDDLPGSFIATNASFNEFDRFIIRPPVDGPNASSFAAYGIAPALSAYRRQGALVIDGFMSVAHIPPRSFERYVSGQIHTKPTDARITPADFAQLGRLPNQRRQTAKELDKWLECLEWQQKLVFIGQESFRYFGYRIGDNGLLRFLVHSKNKPGRLVRKGGTIMLSAGLTESLSPETWQPDPAQRPNLTRLGQVTEAKRLGKNRKFLDDFNLPDELRGDTGFAVITIKPGSDIKGSYDIANDIISQEGFLLSSVGGDLKPISSARNAIKRFCNGGSYNCYLPDYIFNIANAAVSEDIIDIFAANNSFANLNDDQEKAVNKIMSTPDIALIQGPPGTGKTTVIAEVCYQEAKRGHRVLVVSQTNAAVDNVLSRLSSDPTLRPLRIGNQIRIDPEFQIFLSDNAPGCWFKAVRHNCIQKINENMQIDKVIKEAGQGIENLTSVLNQFERVSDSISQQNSGKDRLTNEKESLLTKHKQTTKAVEILKRQKAALKDLIIWLSNPQASPISLALLDSTKSTERVEQVTQAFSGVLNTVLAMINQHELPETQHGMENENTNDHSWNKWLDKIKTAAKNLYSYDNAPWEIPWLAIEQTNNASDYWQMISLACQVSFIGDDLNSRICEAKAFCTGTSTQSNPHQANKLSKLFSKKAQLINSDSNDDLLEVANINRQINLLQSDSWGKLCRDIHGLLLIPFQNNLPRILEDFVASLQPDKKWLKSLDKLLLLCQALTGPCQDILTTGLADIKAIATTETEQIQDRINNIEDEITEFTSAVEELDYQISQIASDLDDLQSQLNEYSSRWINLWPKVCPDMDTPPETASEINRDSLNHRTELFENWINTNAEQRQHQEKWNLIREDWTLKLSDPQTAVDKEIQASYTRYANVVGLTCLETGQRSFHDADDFRPFDTVIIDEVSKATPAELLMPMMCGRKVVLVGDHRQLPPMFKEKESSFAEAVEDGQINSEDFAKYHQLVTSSFFETLFIYTSNSIRQSLFIQYRMHPQIMKAINQFYEGKLLAAGGADNLDKFKQHYLTIKDKRGGKFLEPHQHILWIDSSKDPNGKVALEKQVRSSKANYLEIELVISSLMLLNKALTARGYCPIKKTKATSRQDGITLRTWIKELLPHATDEVIDDIFSRNQIKIDGYTATTDHIVKRGNMLLLDGRMPVGVITFYGAQLGLLRRKIDHIIATNPRYLESLNIKTNTVDKFQGMEMPIIIVSLVRASHHRNVGGFVKEYKRINVAFSRAQNLLIIIGSERTFCNAMVELPNMTDGTIEKIAAYKNIYEMVTQFGGRKYARQILKWKK